jgi:D-alanyl-D-alanine dipeptidase
MVVKIDENEPNIFPTVDATDVEAKSTGRELDVVLITRIEGQAVRVRVKFDQAKARVLADQLKKVLGA